jgi:hypothetical protein
VKIDGYFKGVKYNFPKKKPHKRASSNPTANNYKSNRDLYLYLSDDKSITGVSKQSLTLG